MVAHWPDFGKNARLFGNAIMIIIGNASPIAIVLNISSPIKNDWNKATDRAAPKRALCKVLQ